MTKLRSIIIFWLGLAAVLVIFYRYSFFLQFFQDDWFTFRIAHISRIKDVLNFFIFRSDVIYYRPLGMQAYFALMNFFFGLNPQAFKVVSLFFIIFTVYLYNLALKTLKVSFKVRYFASLMGGLSSVFYIPVYWASTFPFLLIQIPIMLSFISFLRFSESGRKIHCYLSISFFILGLFINEIIYVLPFIFLGYLVLIKQDLKGSKVPFLMLAISIVFVSLRFLVSSIPDKVYSFSLTLAQLSNLRYYILWTFNWPDEIANQFVSLFTLNSEFIKNFNPYVKGLTLSLFTTAALLIIFFTRIIFLLKALPKREERKLIEGRLRLAGFAVVWYLASLTPVLFIKDHNFSYYSIAPLFGFILFLSAIFEIKGNLVFPPLLVKTAMLVILPLWVYGFSLCLEFNHKVHWAEARARESQRLLYQVKLNALKKENGRVYIEISSDSSQAKYALNDQDALKVIYKRDDILTVYK